MRWKAFWVGLAYFLLMLLLNGLVIFLADNISLWFWLLMIIVFPVDLFITGLIYSLDECGYLD